MFKHIVIIGILALCGCATPSSHEYVTETLDVDFKIITISYSSPVEREEILKLVHSNP